MKVNLQFWDKSEFSGERGWRNTLNKNKLIRSQRVKCIKEKMFRLKSSSLPARLRYGSEKAFDSQTRRCLLKQVGPFRIAEKDGTFNLSHLIDKFHFRPTATEKNTLGVRVNVLEVHCRVTKPYMFDQWKDLDSHSGRTVLIILCTIKGLKKTKAITVPFISSKNGGVV